MEGTMSNPRGRPFQLGNTMGRGRPAGSRNKAKSAGQDLLDEYALHLLRKCISLAMKGDLGAMRLCMERISPARQEACIRMILPTIKTAQDVETAAEKVTQAMTRGKVTPTEGGKVISILEVRSRMIEKAQWENRLEKLEENMATDDPAGAAGRG